MAREAGRDRRVLVAGYYGYGNLGDEILREALTQSLVRSGKARPLVLVRRPTRDGEVHRFDPLAILRALRGAGGLVLGGGGLLQNRTSARSLCYYLAVIALARSLRRPVLLAGQGIGPIEGRAARALTRLVLRGAAYLGCRDDASASLLRELGLRPTVDGDLAFLLPSFDRPSREPGPTRIAICLKGGASRVAADRQAAEVVDLLEGVAVREAAEVRLVVFFPSQDVLLAESLARRLEQATLAVPDDADDATRLLAGADLVLASRLHAALLALRAGSPLLAVEEDPKMRAFAEQVRGVGGPAIPVSSRLDIETARLLLKNPPTASELQGAYLRLHDRTARAFGVFLGRLDAALGGERV